MADSKMFAKSGGEWVPVYPDPARGAAPTLSATPAATEIVYTWTAAAGLTVASYELDFDGVIENVGNVLTVTKTGLTTGSSHTARVRAKSDENVRGPWSNLLTTVAAVPYNVATGGTPVDVPNYNGTGQTWRVHTFTASGTFAVTKAGQPFRVMAVGGGGGGGPAPGGGGAGGFLVEDQAVTLPASANAVVVGGGGGGVAYGWETGGTGGVSSLGTVSANGGPGAPNNGAGGAANGGTSAISGTLTTYGGGGPANWQCNKNCNGSPGSALWNPPNPGGGGAGERQEGGCCGGSGGRAGVVIVAYQIG